ncbi:hypothetical protein AGMMS49921_06800 [Endomicrobiia bacterium]|nr:hypothetical protein AGMMS49921_06800 [Endomicrobiia bacterium]
MPKEVFITTSSGISVMSLKRLCIDLAIVVMSMPQDIVALACGSISTSKTFFPALYNPQQD